MQVYEHEHRILTHEADAFGLWRPDAAFRLMQELAGTHSALLGFSRDDLLRDKGCVWMIARAQLQMHAYPKLYDTIMAKTWYGEPGRTTYPRFVEFVDSSGAPVASMATSWIVVDIETRHILLPSRANLLFPPAADLAPTLEEPKKLRLNKEGKVTERSPQYSDLDVNGHMNNANYVTWILDLFPISFHSAHCLRSLSVGYSAEAKPGEPVEMALSQNGNEFDVFGADKFDMHTVFEARGEWADKQTMKNVENR